LKARLDPTGGEMLDRLTAASRRGREETGAGSEKAEALRAAMEQLVDARAALAGHTERLGLFRERLPQ